jgi:hypothetical protein
MKKRLLLAALGASALLAACGSSNECTKKTCQDLSASCGTPSDGCGGTLSCGSCGAGLACGDGNNNSVANVCGFAQPAGTVAIDFKVNDSTNKLYKDGELNWKGSYSKFDAGTRIATFDTSWQGGAATAVWPLLYDDGPWNKGGHEPIGSTAGDHILGVTIFIKPPATGTQAYSYGLEDYIYVNNWTTIAGANETPNGWMWPPGPNGAYNVAAGATGTINAGSFTLTPGGSVDIQLVLDTTTLPPRLLPDGGTILPDGGVLPPWDASHVQLKSNAWFWGTVTLKDDGSTYGDKAANDKKYTFTLSSVVPSPFVHNAFLKSTDKVEFVFQLGGVEFKDGSGSVFLSNVTAGTRTAGSGAAFTPVTPTLADNKNGQIVIP